MLDYLARMDELQSSQHIDLRGTPCPINFVRTRLALEDLKSDQVLYVDLDKGEPEAMVIQGLKKEGHKVQIISNQEKCLTLMVVPCDR